MTTGCQSTGTCESRCGSGSDQDCWCDEQCDIRGDCCCDIHDFCNLESAFGINTTTSSPGSNTLVFTLRPIREGSAVDNTTSSAIKSSDDLTFDLAASTTPDPDCGCRTNEVGPVVGGCCQFPFTYAGVEHNTCIEVGGCQSWCATQLDTLGRYIPDMWGFCGDTCTWDTPTPLPVTQAAIVTEEEAATAITGNTTATSSESSSEESLSSSTESSVISESSTQRPFKPSDEFINSLPPDHSFVRIHEDLHDPVRVSTFNLFSSLTRPFTSSSLGGYKHFIETEHLLNS